MRWDKHRHTKIYMNENTYTEGHYHDTPGTRVSVWLTLWWMTVGRIVGTRESVWCDWWIWSRALHKRETASVCTFPPICMYYVSPLIVFSIFQICRLEKKSYVITSVTYLTWFFLNKFWYTTQDAKKEGISQAKCSILPFKQSWWTIQKPAFTLFRESFIPASLQECWVVRVQLHPS